MSGVDLSDYVDVATRIAEFRSKHPDGSLQPADLSVPYRVETIGDQTFIVYQAAAYRTPDDMRPGIGTAWEQFPGRTPYTKGSELQNAETSAWGRAIMAVLAADARRGVASQEEIRNRRAERDQTPPEPQFEKPDPRADLRTQIAALARQQEIPLDTVADTFQGNYRVPIGVGSVDMLTAFLAELGEDAAAAADHPAAAEAPTDDAGAVGGGEEGVP